MAGDEVSVGKDLLPGLLSGQDGCDGSGFSDSRIS